MIKNKRLIIIFNFIYLYYVSKSIQYFCNQNRFALYSFKLNKPPIRTSWNLFPQANQSWPKAKTQWTSPLPAKPSAPHWHSNFSLLTVWNASFTGKILFLWLKANKKNGHISNPKCLVSLWIILPTIKYQCNQPIFTDEFLNEDTEIKESDTETMQMIKEIINTRVRPSVQDDGGDIELSNFDEKTGVIFFPIIYSLFIFILVFLKMIIF